MSRTGRIVILSASFLGTGRIVVHNTTHPALSRFDSGSFLAGH